MVVVSVGAVIPVLFGRETIGQSKAFARRFRSRPEATGPKVRKTQKWQCSQHRLEMIIGQSS